MHCLGGFLGLIVGIDCWDALKYIPTEIASLRDCGVGFGFN
jgi:hypothetical protein